jgi:hypothetical protein
MIGRYFTYTVLGAILMIGWNVFLIQRDDALYKSHYRQQAIENLKQAPSTEIR